MKILMVLNLAQSTRQHWLPNSASQLRAGPDTLNLVA